MKPLVAPILVYDYYSDVFSNIASSVCPNLVASVTGVSPSAFFAYTEAPHMTKNLARSGLGCWPQHRCKAVSPLAFFKSKSVSSMLRKNFSSSILSDLTAKCRRQLS